jgi:hypothetical protein
VATRICVFTRSVADARGWAAACEREVMNMWIRMIGHQGTKDGVRMARSAAPSLSALPSSISH